MTNKKLPHFLGIGAQKSATRWLYNQLRRHPNIYLTPIKELHYFDKLRKIDVYSERYGLDVWKNNFYKISFWRFLNLSWQFNFFYGKYSDEWYSSQFNKAGNRKAGEITPEYSILQKEDIEIIKNINPAMRIIYLLRNPVSRAWSHFRMQVRRNGLQYEEMSEKDIFNMIGSANYFNRGNYLDNLKRWYSVFEEEKIFIGYLEEVKVNPNALLMKVLMHIGVDADSTHFQESTEEASNVGQIIPLEAKYRYFLQEQYFQCNKDLYEMLGNPIIKNWNNNEDK